MPDIDNPLSMLRGDPESPMWVVLERARELANEGKTSEAKQQCQSALTMTNNADDILGFGLAQACQAYILGLSDRQTERKEGARAADAAMENFRILRGQHALLGQHNEAIVHLIRARAHYKAKGWYEAHSAYRASRERLERLLHRQELAAKQALDNENKQQAYQHEQQANEYRTLIELISQQLEKIAHTIAGSPRPTAEQQIPTPKRHEPASDGQITVDSLFFLPVIGAIPAGQPRISHDYIQDEATVDQVSIDGTKYYVKRLRGEGSLIRLDQREYDYYLSPVIGDSMNQARIHSQADIHIDEGDYVMLRQPRASKVSPDPGDIIAASIADIDREMTLKRYNRRGNTIVLEPESSNPDNEPHVFHEGDPEVTIVATAIAVLKPVQEGEHQ